MNDADRNSRWRQAIPANAGGALTRFRSSGFAACFYNAARGFGADLCSLRASALTFYSLLSIVPVIAMLFGVAKGFGFEEMLQQKLMEQIPDQEKMMIQLIGFSRNLLDNARGGLVAGVGIGVLFVTVIKMVANIEDSFNHIWKLKHGRSLARKVNDYLSPVVLLPVLLLMSGSISVLVRTKISALSAYEYVPDLGVRLVLYTLNYIPFLILWGLFAFLFIYLPNTAVRLKPGVIAGFITAVGFQLLQWAVISLQVGVSSYNVIYGGFSVLPLFVTWLQITWMVVLFGAELCFSLDNPSVPSADAVESALSISQQKQVALRIVHLVVARMRADEEPLADCAIAGYLSLPVSRAREVIELLVEGGVLARIQTGTRLESRYLPARDPGAMTLVSVIADFERAAPAVLPDAPGSGWAIRLGESFAEYAVHWQDNRLITDIGRDDSGVMQEGGRVLTDS